MNAVVLVGGGGTRLRPLTYAIAKPLIPVLNRPLIVHILDNLKRHGVERVVLAASAKDRSIEKAIGDGSQLGLDVRYSYESEPLGSGLAVKAAARDFDSAFFVCNGDVITDVDLSAMSALHRERRATLSIFLAPVEDPTAYGVAELGEADRIVRFVEKPALADAPSNWANAGTWLFDPEVLDHIPDERMDRSLEQLVFPALIGDGFLVQGYASIAYWMDVGTSERYLQLHKDILAGRLTGILSGERTQGPLIDRRADLDVAVEADPKVIVAADTIVRAGASLKGPSVLGEACLIEQGATVERAVLWNKVVIGEAALVRDSIVAEGCVIGAGAVVDGAVLANGAQVRPGVRLGPGARLEPGEIAT
jgi:mannose-1-phosphate guanylyltransferase